MLCFNVLLLNSLSAKRKRRKKKKKKKKKKKYIVEIVLESKNGRYISKDEGCSQA